MPTDQKPLTLPSHAATNSPLSPPVQNALYSALLSSSGIPTIQQTLTHELQASGWTMNLRTYIQALLRSGECTTYNEVMKRVLEETRGAESEEKSNGTTNGVNGNAHGKENGVVEGKSVEEGGIKIPERAVREGVRVVRRELEKVCDITVEGEEK